MHRKTSIMAMCVLRFNQESQQCEIYTATKRFTPVLATESFYTFSHFGLNEYVSTKILQ